tara:strand:+ start:264 stop:689 length:426 start_codon:yes stop_codon:yes gene_type:complete
MPFNYLPRTNQQLRNTFNRKVRGELNDFIDFNDFLDWFQEQPLQCDYCGLTEVELQEITMTGILTSKRFPQNGIVGRGTNRGVWLEFDRLEPNGLYSRNNCVLACYFCNNDKSDVFDGQSYRLFFKNRVEYLRLLLSENAE